MARKCKCKYCGKQLTTDIAWAYEYLTDDLEIRKKYYCSEDCYKAEEKAKLIQEDCFERLDVLLGFDTKSHRYFRKLLKSTTDIYGFESLQKFLISESYEIECAMNRIDFSSTNAQINYFITILQNNISKYKKSIDEERIIEISKGMEVVEYEQKRPRRDKRKKRKRSLDEVFGDEVK